MWNPTRTIFPDSVKRYLKADSVIRLPENVNARFITVIGDAGLGTDTLYISTNNYPRTTGMWILKSQSLRVPCDNVSGIRISSHATGYIYRYFWER